MNRRLFPGVPLIESPIFSLANLPADWSAEEMSLAHSLHENGFAVIDFPDPDIDARIARMRRNLAPHFEMDLESPISDKTRGTRRMQDAWKFDEDVRAIASNSTILDLLGKLYGRPAFPFQTLNFPVGTEQRAHSDSVHFSSIPERFMCGVWLAMEDVPAEAGPLFYVRGSHRWPIMNNALIGRRGHGIELSSAQDPYGPAWEALCKIHDGKKEPFLARKGQALIWCANLLHGGSRQSDPTLTRWSQVTHYFFDDCIYYTPAFSDEAIGKIAMRNIVAIHDGKARPNSYMREEIANTACQNVNGKSPTSGFFRRFILRILS
ncbi:phytanoyl-CoA dioxygenase family protein [Sphingobium herbicidovorans]